MSARILVAISGGVDSSVAAYLLLQQGFKVEGVYLRTWQSEDGFGECPWRDDLESAKNAANHLHIPLRILNLIEAYKKDVVTPMISGYQCGLTPNPDMLCNRHIKFGKLLDYAKAEGFDGLATGHYCRIEKNSSGQFILREGIDPNKDQSYFLALIQKDALPWIHFPVGSWTKKKVRKIAVEAALPNARRPDSQDICFLGGKVSIQAFLDRYIPAQPGSIVTQSGLILGQHRGLHHYTLGQRKGIGIPSNRDYEKYVVVGKKIKENQLVVALESNRENGIWSDKATIERLNFLGRQLTGTVDLLTKVRYRDPAVDATLTFGNGRAMVKFQQVQRALAPGQILAFYEKDRLLGGGFFQSIG